MLLELSKILNLSVGALDERRAVGEVDKVAIALEDARVIGFLVKLKGILSSRKAVSFQDVVDIDHKGLVINSAESLLPVGEIVRIKEIFASHFNLVGLPARTKNKKSLGRVTDAVVETTSGDIIRIYVKSLWDERIFERSMIHEIKKNEIILTFDDRQKAKQKQSILAGEKVSEAA